MILPRVNRKQSARISFQSIERGPKNEEEAKPEEDEDQVEEQQDEQREDSSCSGWTDIDPDRVELPKINLEYDFGVAKRYLESLGERDESVWTHLSEIIGHVLRARPPDCMRYFEELSRDLRMKRYVLQPDPVAEARFIPPRLKEADELVRFYRKVQCLYMDDNEFVDDGPADKELVETYSLLRDAGIGIPSTDLYNLYMGIRALAKETNMESLNLWGIIRGTKKNYYVVRGKPGPMPPGNVQAEDALKDEDETRVVIPMVMVQKEQRESLQEQQRKESIEPVQTSAEIAAEPQEQPPKEEIQPKKINYTFPPLPVPDDLVLYFPPKEPRGTGVNRYVYYVSNRPIGPWKELPDVLPQWMIQAKKIHKFFTGNLEEPVVSYPEFPGNESVLLRCQIARITASTHVSPAGYYDNPYEEEEFREPEEGELFNENADYESLPVRSLTDESLRYWVHHEKFILGHGTTVPWKKPSPAKEDQGEEMEDEEEEEPMEMPPELLRDLSKDVMDEHLPAWTARATSLLMKEDSAVKITSNVWPGAVTVTKGRKFVNFYCGWGIKTQFGGFKPPIVGPVQKEYPLGPEIMEITDPTAEMEEFRWQMLHPPPFENYGEEFEQEEMSEDLESKD